MVIINSNKHCNYAWNSIFGTFCHTLITDPLMELLWGLAPCFTDNRLADTSSWWLSSAPWWGVLLLTKGFPREDRQPQHPPFKQTLSEETGHLLSISECPGTLQVPSPRWRFSVTVTNVKQDKIPKTKTLCVNQGEYQSSNTFNHWFSRLWPSCILFSLYLPDSQMSWVSSTKIRFCQMWMHSPFSLISLGYGRHSVLVSLWNRVLLFGQCDGSSLCWWDQ